MKYLSLLTFGIMALSSTSIIAQEASSIASPIFISPYTQSTQTYESRIPMVAKPPKQRAQNYTAPGRHSYNEEDQPKFVTYDNPLTAPGSAFMRSSNEEYFKDDTTGKTYNQYDYMALLYKRNDMGKLNQILSNVQRNGVFDPQKYQDIMMQAKAEKTGTGGSPSGGSSLGGTPINKARIVRAQNNKQDSTPRRIHQGYDEAEPSNVSKAPSPKISEGSAPIFLR